MIPKNLLDMALSVLPKNEVEWERFDRIETDDRGKEVPKYQRPVKVTGSWQSVSANTIQQLGLSAEKQYRMFYASKPITSLVNKTSPDIVTYNGESYEAVGNSADWYDQNGWKGVLLVKVKRY